MLHILLVVICVFGGFWIAPAFLLVGYCALHKYSVSITPEYVPQHPDPQTIACSSS
jgi:hypothetical protein